MLSSTGNGEVNALKVVYPEEPQRATDCYRLLEVGDKRLLAAIEEGRELWIRGDDSDDAVLCTERETFRLRELVTSNMLLVVERASSGETGMIVGTSATTLEATLLARPPGIDRLVAALDSVPYNGHLADDPVHPADTLHVTRLYEWIQASGEEIDACLQAHGAIVVNEHYRVLGAHLLCRFFELFFNTAVLEDWNVAESLSLPVVWAAFSQYEDEFSERIVCHILRHYSRTRDQDDATVLLDGVAICRFFAMQLLRARSQWAAEDFVAAWERPLADVFKPTMADIADMILTDRHPGSGRVELRRFLRTDLPSDVEMRFIALFKTRSRWSYDELVPFIQDLGRDSKEVDGIVLKHGRVSTVKNVRFVTPRSQLLD